MVLSYISDGKMQRHFWKFATGEFWWLEIFWGIFPVKLKTFFGGSLPIWFHVTNIPSPSLAIMEGKIVVKESALKLADVSPQNPS